jgi:hypothetical protein
VRFALSKDTIMKEPISSYEDYCRVWAEVYKKHAKHSERTVFSCYVRDGIRKALNRGELRKPKQEVTTDEDIIGIYIARALVAQGMSESAILDYTEQMQDYVDAADDTHDCIDLMEQGLYAMGVDALVEAQFIYNVRNRLRYLWAKHGGFDLMAVTEL